MNRQIALLLILATAAFFLWFGWAYAHQAPTGWAYDASCCSGKDCAPAETRMSPEGLQMKHGGQWYTIGPEVRRKQSGDAMNHLCVLQATNTPICVYLSAGI